MRLLAIVIVLSAIPVAPLAQDKGPRRELLPTIPYGGALILCESLVAKDCFAALQRRIDRNEVAQHRIDHRNDLARPAQLCSEYKDQALRRGCERGLNDYLNAWWHRRSAN